MTVTASPSGSVLLSTDIPALRPFIKGKVRDVYDLGDRLLLITTDRISAFDSVLPTGIPDKGRVLNSISAYWFQQIRGICGSHMISVDPDDLGRAVREAGGQAEPELLAGRAMLGFKARALPVECVVRGYLDGSAWKEYRQSGSVCGIELPPGLRQGDRLPEPIFTPATKAHTGHDENISVERMLELDDPELLEAALKASLAVYRFASDQARDRGLIIADTKFEFGEWNGELIMIDECLTPDSSRFWDAEQWRPGGPQPSFDKQFVRDYLDGIGWDHEPPAPPLPPEVAEATADRYRELYRRVTGAPLPGLHS